MYIDEICLNAKYAEKSIKISIHDMMQSSYKSQDSLHVSEVINFTWKCSDKAASFSSLAWCHQIYMAYEDEEVEAQSAPRP